MNVSATQLTEAGLDHDRTFMVVGPDGTFRSQRRDPRLALIRPVIDTAGRRLGLRADGTDPIDIEVDVEGPRRPVVLFGTTYYGIDQGDEVAQWISHILGADSRLVRVPPEHHRVTGGLTPGISGFADSSPVHLISSESLAQLNAVIADKGGVALPMNRFRPNIVVDGWPGPHREDLARGIVIAGAELGFAKPSIRCVTTMVDQFAGARAGTEPLRSLATYRRTPDGIAFGAKFSVLRPARLALGDECMVTESQPDPVSVLLPSALPVLGGARRRA
ncbi:MOSC domain-containing protein [Mycobacterium sp. 21AC1]|nr:MOSC domain-containing protein [Mycobacterium sp. 21AC1]